MWLEEATKCGQWLRHDTIEEFNVDSQAEYSALSSTRSQKKTKTNKRQCPFNDSAE